MSSNTSQPRDAASLQIFSDSMMQDHSLPLSDVIGNGLFKEAFEKFDVQFGAEDDAVYTPQIVLWTLISQALFTKEERSLGAAVTRIALWWACQGRVVDDTNTGAYSRARQKLPVDMIAWLTREVASRCESSEDLTEPVEQEQADETWTPDVIAQVRTEPIQGRVILIDGFTVDAADTPENQAEYPQNPAQKEGLGFPLLRCVCLTSMATGLMIDLAIGPYAGKESGETALLLQLFDALKPGDILVADSYYCTYWLIAYCRKHGIELVMKNHHKRDDQPEDATRICKWQRKVTWSRPARPDWMTPEEYGTYAKTVEVG